jgi:hypothetical protein
MSVHAVGTSSASVRPAGTAAATVTPSGRATRSLKPLVAALATVVGLTLVPGSQPAWAASDHSSCVEKFNIAVGTPGEYQRVFHQKMLGRDVSFFARLSDDQCPF